MGDGELPAEDECGEMTAVAQDPDPDVAHAFTGGWGAGVGTLAREYAVIRRLSAFAY